MIVIYIVVIIMKNNTFSKKRKENSIQLFQEVFKTKDVPEVEKVQEINLQEMIFKAFDPENTIYIVFNANEVITYGMYLDLFIDKTMKGRCENGIY